MKNQFIIYGVQLGFFGLALYLTLLITAISFCIRAYYRSQTPAQQMVPFVAAAVKFGLLLPSMTSNIETYLYISTLSWWLVGYAVLNDRKNYLQEKWVL